MKRFLAYILIFLILCFSIPIIFTSKAKPTISDNTENKEEQQTVADYDYKQYNTVKLLHTSTNKVEKLGLDEYLYGVVSSEMPASFEKEALKAQAVVARTYTLYKIIMVEKNMETLIYVIHQLVAKHGFRRRKD